MRVVDTSAWIEWLVSSSTGLHVRHNLPDREEWLVPTIVQLELTKWMLREADEARMEQVIAFTQACVVAPLDTRIAIAAAEAGRKYRLATADAIVQATARAFDADLLTCDAHFAELPEVIFIAKSPE